MNKTLIISGGEYDPSIQTEDFDYIIACDKGYEYCNKLGIVPNLVIGDFDSTSLSDIQNSIQNTETELLTFPIRKDDTDTMLAIKHAMSLGSNHICIACGLGLRLDHTFANIQSMHYVAAHGGVCEMISSKEYMRTIIPDDGVVSIAKRDDFSLSLFSLTNETKEVSINGTAYDCVTDFVNSFPLGLGNHFEESEAHISIKKGVLLIVMSHE